MYRQKKWKNMNFEETNTRKYRLLVKCLLFNVKVYVKYWHEPATECNIELTIFCLAYDRMSMAYTKELCIYFIYPLYRTATIIVSKLIYSLRNNINKIYWSLKKTHRTEPNALTNTCIGWYDIKSSGICLNKFKPGIT